MTGPAYPIRSTALRLGRRRDNVRRTHRRRWRAPDPGRFEPPIKRDLGLDRRDDLACGGDKSRALRLRRTIRRP